VYVPHVLNPDDILWLNALLSSTVHQYPPRTGNVCPVPRRPMRAVDGRLIGQYARPTHAIRQPGELRFGVSATNVHAPLAVISLAISSAALSASSMPFAIGAALLG
jgi:hypothetical protein